MPHHTATSAAASPKLAIDIPEAAARLTMSPKFVQREIAAGRLKSKKYGRSRRILVRDLEAFAAARDDAAVVSIGTARRRRRPLPSVLPPYDGPLPLAEYGDGSGYR